jgi:hypothetical protein
MLFYDAILSYRALWRRQYFCIVAIFLIKLVMGATVFRK